MSQQFLQGASCIASCERKYVCPGDIFHRYESVFKFQARGNEQSTFCAASLDAARLREQTTCVHVSCLVKHFAWSFTFLEILSDHVRTLKTQTT